MSTLHGGHFRGRIAVRSAPLSALECRSEAGDLRGDVRAWGVGGAGGAAAFADRRYEVLQQLNQQVTAVLKCGFGWFVPALPWTVILLVWLASA